MTLQLKLYGEYPAKSFKPLASKVWSQFFKTMPNECDFAFWNIEFYSAVLYVTPRISSAYEGDPTWSPPPPIFIAIDGLLDLVSFESEDEDEKVRDDFEQWVVQGILESFHSLRISKKFEQKFPKSDSFSIIISPTDEDFEFDELTLIWSNKRGHSVEEIRKRQKTAERIFKKKGTRKKVVKKKTVAKKRTPKRKR